MPFISFKTKKIHFRLEQVNGKRAIIFIHGSGCSANLWKNQMKLKIDYDLISIDLPSHGKSDSFSDLTLELYINALRALVSELKYDEIILCGHSLGGAIAQSYYFKYSDHIKALVLVGTGARLRVSPFILSALKNDFNAYLDSLPAGAFYRKTDKQVINELVEEISTIPSEVTYSDFNICDNFDILNKVKNGEVNIPCLMIVGNADKLTPIKYSQFFSEYIKNSEIIIIKNAGHMVMVEKPEELNNAIINFLKKYFNGE